MNAIKMRYGLYEIQKWLRTLATDVGLNTVMDACPSGFPGAEYLAQMLDELRKPKFGYLVHLRPNPYGGLIFLEIGQGRGCAFRESLGYGGGGEVFDVFSDQDISELLASHPYVRSYEKMDQYEIDQWA